ncbi:MAG: hypothetical protein ACR2IT_05335 [Pirellulales bacterium]
MLVVTSNWALGDATLFRGGGWQAALPGAVHRAAIRGGFRDDGTYRPIESLDLVIAGDTFDWLASAAWCGRSRPWHSGGHARETLLGIAHGSLRSARRLLATVTRWADRGLAVPAADTRSRPAGREVTVPVRVTLLAGDRDAALADVARHLPRQPFAIGESWSDDTLTIRHGHDLDPACRRADDEDARSSGGRPPTLAESVGIDLVVRFAAAARRRVPELPGMGRLLRGLACAKPVDLPFTIATWRADVEGDRPGCVEQARVISSTWRRAVAEWLSEARREVPACEVEFDAVHCLAAWLDGAFRSNDEPVIVPAGIQRLRGRAAFPVGVPPAADPSEGGPRLVVGHFDHESVGLRESCGLEPTPTVMAVRRRPSGFCWETIMAGEHRPSIVTIAPSGWDRGGAVVDAA